VTGIVRLALIETALLWFAAAALDGLRGEGRLHELALAATCAGLAAALAWRRRSGWWIALAGSGLAVSGESLWLVRSGASLAELQWRAWALAWAVFAAFLLLPATREAFRFGTGAAARTTGALVALPVQILTLAACGLFAFLGAFYAHDGMRGIWRPYERRTEPDLRHPELGVEWAMHPVDNPGDLLPNGLDAADVNGDGWPDYVTNYELEGRVRVALHPGAALDPERPWPALDVGEIRNAESSALGDLDGDGLADVVVVHGVEGTELAPAVRLYWGERQTTASGGYRWIDGGDIPSSSGGWHFLYTKAADLDADGDLDVIAGGRGARLAFGDKRSLGSRPLVYAGIRWFENPGGDPARRRDLSRWRGHAIDPDSRSGHGFELGDLDGDGDPDLANANSDFDTPEHEENVVWYRNPGPGAGDQTWPVYELLRSDEWYAKEQVAIGDLDGDGRNDVLAHAPERIYWFRNLGSVDPGSPPGFETLEIGKHPATRHRARPLELADLDGDGALEIVGALIHHDGVLSSDKAAVFSVERQPDRSWATRVIKWSDGFRGLPLPRIREMNGEKWDQILPADVDRDGDLDLMANVEEYNRLRSVLAVVWFENPRIQRRP
jgi:hypothetical protein